MCIRWQEAFGTSCGSCWLAVMLQHWNRLIAYIKELQAEFDYSRIKYTEDYYECVPAEPKIPKWKVYFDGNLGAPWSWFDCDLEIYHFGLMRYVWER